ncbi:PepSY-associated TM helix domain-containing protein [Modicisalibacter muralis]|uniref:PepSY-associated TM helix domain-containing protein n=1 Tax=Modicisalibacter muralis TaxID=119000 RepID=UPI001FE2143B|nr:PepSY-associated TM helix domain-containing protein [Halomonas muralis]
MSDNNASRNSSSTAPPGSPGATTAPPVGSLLKALLIRLHFYIGLFIGPFILFAALSGSLYALSPHLEQWLYHDQLYTPQRGPAQPLAEQIAVAQRVIGDDAQLSAVRPAPEPGMTTRVMYSAPTLGPSESRAIFVDPVTLEVRGDLVVYGTSGALPLRSWIDHLHRSLLLGDLGRHYSELAASWLWVAALAGLAIWWFGPRRARRQAARNAAVKASPSQRRARLRWRHSTLGLCLLIGMLFFSATGLTWSQWAGGNIGVLRAAWGWSTPSVSTQLDPSAKSDMSGHQHHAMASMDTQPHVSFALADFDAVLAAARAAGLDAGRIEIQPATSASAAWKVKEIDRRWPTQVDEVAIDVRDMGVVDRVRFAEYPLAAKLTRWGIDAHMGVLFGLPNQLVLVTFAVGICVMVIWGYMMWWRRRPRFPTTAGSDGTLSAIAARLPVSVNLGILLVALALGLALPVMGVSLAAFLLIDVIRGKHAARRANAAVKGA